MVRGLARGEHLTDVDQSGAPERRDTAPPERDRRFARCREAEQRQGGSPSPPRVPGAQPTPLRKMPHPREHFLPGFRELQRGSGTCHPGSSCKLLQARSGEGGHQMQTRECAEPQEVRVYDREASCSRHKGSRGWRNKRNHCAGIGTPLPHHGRAALGQDCAGKPAATSCLSAGTSLFRGCRVRSRPPTSDSGYQREPRCLPSSLHSGTRRTRGRLVTSPPCSCDAIIDIRF